MLFGNTSSTSDRAIGPTLPYGVKAAVTGIRSLAWRAAPRRAENPGLRILFYHRISPEHDELSVHPDRFRRQMEHLADSGYTVVDVSGIVELIDRGLTSARTIGLSFDDGYLDNAEHALPILQEHGFRATVFVATAVTDGRAAFPWCSRQPPLLGWDEIAELDRGETLSFESHTLTHPNLLGVDDARARAEIVESRSELSQHLDRPVTIFSYPAGLFGARERELVIAAGYRAAVSCEPGVNLPATDRFALRRRQIDARDRYLDFQAKVAGGHDTPLPLRSAYRRARYGEGSRAPRLVNSER
jgi:peptidoglycan/xylan/chitin deacetylase (PgdA/CDA1 family)